MLWDIVWWVVIPAVVLLVLSYRSRFFRIFTVILGVLAVLFFPLLQKVYTDVTQQDSSIINNYTLDYDVAANGDQTLVETLDVQFTESKHGIFRFFDESDGVDQDVTHPVTIESVKRCATKGDAKCVSEPYEEYYENGFLVAKIGSAGKTYSAGTVNRYVITSSTTGAITQPQGSAVDQWYWNVIAPGWNMPITKAQVSVAFPVAPTEVRCITESGTCQTTGGDNPRTVLGSYNDLPPRTPVTWQADLPPEGLTAVPVSATTTWWKTPMAFIPGAIAALLLGLLIWRLRERPVNAAPVFAAPTDDILPAVWTYGEDPPEHPFQTMLMQLATLGTVRLEVQAEGQFTDQKPDWVKVWRTDKPVAQVAGAQDFVSGMDLEGSGSVATIDKSDVTMGSKVQSTEAALSNESEAGAQQAGYFSKSTLGFFVNLIASLLAPLAILAVVLFQQRWIGAMLLVPAIVGLWSPWSLRTRLTDQGLAMRDQVAGLRTALSTPASVERFDYALKARYFAQFLPWAVALDCAEEWAEACKPPPGTESGDGYDPTYAAAWSSYNASQAVSTAVASVSAGAVAAYAATQSSSSGGGGGGFSSGGGSGGGGGGSW